MQDITFLKELNNERNIFYYAKIIVLDSLEKPLKTIEGRVQQGSSISLNGDSSMRRTCTISLVAEEAENYLTNLDNFLSVNRKIKIAVGIDKWVDYSKDIYYYKDKNDLVYDEDNPYDHGFPEFGQIGKIYVDRATLTYWKWVGKSYQQIKSIYDYDRDLVWFPLGVFVITQPSISHSTSGCVINLNCKDKMCLLNGELGGSFPASVTFDHYDQIIGELVCSKDPRTDTELEPNNFTIYNYNGTYLSWDRQYGWKVEDSNASVGERVKVKQTFIDIIRTMVVNYGGEATSRIIVNDLPAEIKQLIRYTGSGTLYHNTATGQYTLNELYLTQDGTWTSFSYNEDVGYVYTDFVYPGDLIANVGDNVCTILDKIISVIGNYEYFYDIDGNFVFQEKKNYLNTSYVPTEEVNGTQLYYIDNNRDYEIDTNSLRIIGEDNYRIDLYGDQKSIYSFEENNDLVVSYSNNLNYSNLKNDYHIWGTNSDGFSIHYHLVIKDKPTEMQTRQVVFLTDKFSGKYTGRIRLAKEGEAGVAYTPSDWRAELYLQGLDVAQGGGRPDIYQQELLDLFDDIYEWGYYDTNGSFVQEGRFKTDIVNKPNALRYFIDYLEPVDRLYGCSVDDVKTKIYSMEKDKVIRLYDNSVPDFILIDEQMDDSYEALVMNKCDSAGQKHSVIDHNIYSKLVIGTVGYSAQETVRELLYQHTNYNDNISFQTIPIYSLDVNKRISIRDRKSGIQGDYIIKSLTIPISPNSSMSVSAVRALNRI